MEVARGTLTTASVDVAHSEANLFAASESRSGSNAKAATLSRTWRILSPWHAQSVAHYTKLVPDHVNVRCSRKWAHTHTYTHTRTHTPYTCVSKCICTHMHRFVRSSYNQNGRPGQRLRGDLLSFPPLEQASVTCLALSQIFVATIAAETVFM